MVSKKLIGDILIAVISISLVALIPVFMYGFTVNVAEVNMSIMTTSSLTSSSVSIETKDSYDLYDWGSGWDAPPQINEKAISSYEYVFDKLNGITEVSEGNSLGDNFVEIVITFNLTTPSNNSLIFSFEPQGLRGEGVKNIMVLLGPDELNRQTGTFYLRITISIRVVTPPPVDAVLLDIYLTPVELSFEIPQ
jgi:hypothetical protein